MKNKIIVTGFYGQSNFGDDLFCYILSKAFDDDNCRILNGEFKSKSKVNFYKIPCLSKYYNNKGFLGSISRILTNCWMSIVPDVLIYGGGSVFCKYASLKQRWLTYRLSKYSLTKKYAFGVSIGPFKNIEEESKYIRILSSFDMIFLRDKASETYLDKANINYIRSNDMVWSLSEYVKVEDKKRERIVLCTHSVLDVNKLSDALYNSFNKDQPITVLCLEESEIYHCKKLFDELILKCFIDVEFCCYYKDNIENTIQLLGTAELVITSKLHGAITSAVYGTKFLLFEYQEKCSHLLDEVNYTKEIKNFGNENVFFESIKNYNDISYRAPTPGLILKHLSILKESVYVNE